MIAARDARDPGVGLAVDEGVEVGAVEFVETAVGQAEFCSGRLGGELFSTVAGQDMANEGSGKTLDQLEFFIRARLAEGRGESWIYRIEADSGRGLAKPGRHGGDGPTCRLSGFTRRSGCVPAEPYPPLKRIQIASAAARCQTQTQGLPHYSGFARTTTREKPTIPPTDCPENWQKC